MSNKKQAYEVGVIGGMGPAATADFFAHFVKLTNANQDQAHPSVIIINQPKIPDRTERIIDKTKSSPVHDIQQIIDQLVDLNVKRLVMPCNTAHHFLPKLTIPQKVQFINMIEETKRMLTLTYPNLIGILLATNGTIKTNLYNEDNIIYPSQKEQKEVMTIIYNIKKGTCNELIIDSLDRLLKNIANRIGDCVFILGCTELSFYRNTISPLHPCVDSIDALVKATIKSLGKTIKLL